MYYVQHGTVPRQRHTQHRAPDGSLYAEELFGVEGFAGRSSLLYHLIPPTRTHQVEAGPAVKLEAADDGVHRHHLTKTGDVAPNGDAITGRMPLYFNSDVVMGIVRPAEPMPRPASTATATPTRCSTSTRATGVCETIFGPLRYGPGDYLVLPIGTTWRLDPDAGVGAADAVARVRRRRSSRRSATATTTASCSSTRRTRSATSALPDDAAPRTRRGRLRHPRASSRPHHGLPLPPSPVRRRRLGRLPLAVLVQHRGLPADHRPRPPAAAGPPDVPGAQLRGLLVRAAQVRLPPARDPGAVQPLEHQQRRGHLLRRRQLHEPARGRDRLVHAPPGRASRTGRTRARSRPRSARRRPRSWRSWSTRSTR